MVWDLPVPRALDDEVAPLRTASMAACWVESASRMRCSRDGSGSGGLSGTWARTARSAPGSPARAATTSWSARDAP